MGVPRPWHRTGDDRQQCDAQPDRCYAWRGLLCSRYRQSRGLRHNAQKPSAAAAGSAPMTHPLSVAVAGLGTVGGGVLKLLRDNADVIAARAGRPIAVTAVSARDRTRDRGQSLAGLRWFDDPVAFAADPAIDVVAELIGGAEGVARALVTAGLAAGKPVVTANKALIAIHGAELA